MEIRKQKTEKKKKMKMKMKRVGGGKGGGGEEGKAESCGHFSLRWDGSGSR